MSPEHIIDIFRRVLNLVEVDAGADFFELGGDSLLATRVLSAIAREFGAELFYEDFIENPSPQGIFEKLAAAA